MRIRARSLSGLVAVVLAVAVMTACTPSTPTQPEPAQPAAVESWLDEYGLDGLDARAVIERLDTLPVAERPQALMASVQPEALALLDDKGNELQLPLPEDEFYVSIAPFVTQTHECYFHSLTTCRGELGNVDVDVTVVAEDGTVLVDEAVRTYDNGFVGFWLPRDIVGTVTISDGTRSASQPISTTVEDPSCVTTMQLS